MVPSLVCLKLWGVELELEACCEAAGAVDENHATDPDPAPGVDLYIGGTAARTLEAHREHTVLDAYMANARARVATNCRLAYIEDVQGRRLFVGTFSRGVVGDRDADPLGQ